jgi:hypothetical protein
MSLRTGAGVTSRDTAPGHAELFGNPGTLGTFNVQLTVTDATGATSTNTFPLTVSPLAPDADNEDDANLGTAYQRNYRVIGGTAPYTASLLGHSYPAGMTLTNLTVSGSPLEDGLFLPVLNAADSAAHVFHGQDFGRAGAEDCLVVSQNDLQHLFGPFALADKFVLINHTRHAAFGFLFLAGL